MYNTTPTTNANPRPNAEEQEFCGDAIGIPERSLDQAKYKQRDQLELVCYAVNLS